jgi:predicted ATP-dependent serine protease
MPDTKPRRLRTGSGVFDRLFHGGPVAPSTILLAGPEGAGKTTRALLWAASLAATNGGAALAVSAEMPAALVRSMALRAGCNLAALWVLETFSLEDALREATRIRPLAVVFDSVPTLDAGDAEAGTDEAEARVIRGGIRLARELGAVVWLLTHATAEDKIAGRRRARHDVDAVAWLTPNVLELRKHRFGPAPVSAELPPLPGEARREGRLDKSAGVPGRKKHARKSKDMHDGPGTAEEPAAPDSDGGTDEPAAG